MTENITENVTDDVDGPVAEQRLAASEVSLSGLTKLFGSRTAVQDASLELQLGEMVSLLGPSGCGKTTLLRMAGGFIAPTSGTVSIRGVDVSSVPPHKRDTAMVFQNYALFPHLSVADNIAYGLRRRRVPRDEIARRVQQMLARMRLLEFSERKPNQLSGGQQQRVAVGRALIVNPSVLLLDEPFSALDAQLRESTRVELRALQQESGTTALFVTHDQQEALAISDRVAVMNAGRIEQIGTAQDIYERPATRFVASFIGAANVLDTKIIRSTVAETLTETASGIEIASATDQFREVGTEVACVIRAADVVVSREFDGRLLNCTTRFSATVEVVSYLGETIDLRIKAFDGTLITARTDRGSAADLTHGTEVQVGWPTSAVRIVPAD